MNRTAYNNNTQTLNLPYTLIQPVIPSKQVTFKTPKQQAIWHYKDFILSIMKVMDLQYITHCTNEEYWLITIHGAGDTLIHIVPSNTLQKHLLTQKNKSNSVKTGVLCVKQATMLINGVMHYKTSNLIKEWMEKKRRQP